MKRAICFICILAMLFSGLPLFASGEQAQREVRACWVASVGNLDFPSDMGLSKQKLKAEIDKIVDQCKEFQLNTIFFQIRPMGDALYRSEIFPWSVYLSGTQGVAPEDAFDPLAYFIKQAHREEIQLHAWINPYRIGSGAEVTNRLSSDNPAVLHPEYTVKTAEGLYYNPGLPQVRKLILDGVAEIAKNYEIDGIHFDDYFYPYNGADFDDRLAYETYGQGMSLADFRRHSVDLLVKEVRGVMQKWRKDAQFGISPFGIWANASSHKGGSQTSGMSSYSAIFSDSKKWVEEGWLDYICPQLYWSFDHKAAPFGVLVDWWDDLCRKNDTRLYIGLAPYKMGTDEIGFDDGDLMERQLQYIAQKDSYAGHCFFRYGVLTQNPLGATDSILKYYNSAGQTAQQKGSIRILPSPKGVVFPDLQLSAATQLTVNAPANGTTVTAEGISVSGTAPAGQAVYVNGIKAVSNKWGLYSAYVSLKNGKNTLSVSSGNFNKNVNVYRSAPSAIEGLQNPYPTGAAYYGSGDVFTFSVSAPAGSVVTLENQWITLPLVATEKAPTTYCGQWTVPTIPGGDGLVLNQFVVSAQIGEKLVQTPVDLQLHLQKDYKERLVLQTDGYLFDSSTDGSQMDHDPLQKGTVVTVCAKEGTRARLDNGLWLEQAVLSANNQRPVAPMDYSYETVTLSCEGTFSYYSEYAQNELTLYINAGQRHFPQPDFDSGDLVCAWSGGMQQGTLKISSRSGRKIAGYELFPQKNRVTVNLWFYSGGLEGKTIVLDAGHGGNDTGALSAGGSAYPDEFDLNMVMCDHLSQELKKAGAEVILLAAGSEDLPLDQRVELSKKVAPDLFLSVHHNSTEQTADFSKTSGGLVLYSSPLSKSLADHLSKCFLQDVGTAQVKRQSLRVCRQTGFAAVMLEVGYICNPMEYQMLCDEDIVRKIAKNTVDGIASYFTSFS